MIVELQEISKVIMGQSPKGESYNDQKIGLPLLNGAADYKGKVFKPKYYTSEPTRTAKKGDILLGVRATIGNFTFSDNEYCIGRGVAAIRVDENKADKGYVIKCVEKGLNEIIHTLSGSTIKGIRKEDLTEMKLNLPPLPQQQKIANILDAADALRQNNKALIAKYDELTQALFLDMFGDPVSNSKGWKKVSGKIVFKLVGGAAFKSSDYTLVGLPLIRIGTVNKGYFDNSQLAFLPKSFEETHLRYIVYPNDLLITLTGTVGKDDYGNAFTLSYEYEKYLLNQRVAKICSSDNYNLVFLKFFLKQKKVKNELIGVSRGVRQANLSNEDFYKLEVINPSIDLQNQFAKRVAVIEEQKTIAQKSLEHSESLFNSLLQKAFKGELV